MTCRNLDRGLHGHGLGAGAGALRGAIDFHIKIQEGAVTAKPVGQISAERGVGGCVCTGEGLTIEQGIGVTDVEDGQEAVLKLICAQVLDGVAETAL